ncbi:MAG: metallophosphoesterase family protein [Clostridiaceae bacterium]|nr:metallophosphoesterase family protein [Clostridiaceae bacterium]
MEEFTIGVVSDTHMPNKAEALPIQLLEGLKGVKLIIHAGDFVKDHVVYELEEIAPVTGVYGNNDDEYIRSMFGFKKIIEVMGFRIGVTHGDGSYSTTLNRAIKVFEKDVVDCVIFGHSHMPFNETIGNILYFNPGSPTDKRRQQHFSYGILKVGENRISGDLKFF